MKTRGVDADDALEVVRRAHPDAHPNAGFGNSACAPMDCKLNMADEAYRLSSVARPARRRNTAGTSTPRNVQPDPGADVDDSLATTVRAVHGSATSRRSVRGWGRTGGRDDDPMQAVRRLVARGRDVPPHRPGRSTCP